jgi:hypothetical protein
MVEQKLSQPSLCAEHVDERLGDGPTARALQSASNVKLSLIGSDSFRVSFVVSLSVISVELSSSKHYDCRGPFVLAEQTSSKYEIIGTGQVR